MRAWLLLFVLPIVSPRFSTWDEPWHEDVVRAADALVKVEVLSNEEGKKVTAKVLDRVAGDAVPDRIVIDRYSMLALRSYSQPDDETQFRLSKGGVYYLFLDKPEKGDGFALATPTASHAEVEDGKVTATYRHSCHQALVPEAIYRETQKAIFVALHGGKHDDAAMQKLMREWLKREPGRLSDDASASQTFFCQHAALECFYYFGKPEDVGLLGPFLRDDTEHTQISAVRALSRIDTKDTRDQLLAFLAGDGSGFAKVMAVRGLRRLDARDCAQRLERLAANASTKELGFGIGIMDPRIATRFPASVKAAIEELLADWKKKPKDDASGKR